MQYLQSNKKKTWSAQLRNIETRLIRVPKDERHASLIPALQLSFTYKEHTTIYKNSIKFLWTDIHLQLGYKKTIQFVKTDGHPPFKNTAAEPQVLMNVRVKVSNLHVFVLILKQQLHNCWNCFKHMFQAIM